MGIPNFRQFITSKIKDPIKQVDFNDIKFKSVCIDINIFIYKFITAIRRTGKDIIKDGELVSHLIGLKNQINLFKKLNIDIIYVFDGNAPIEKTRTLDERKEKNKNAEKIYAKTKSVQSFQQSFYITDDIINTTMKFLEKNDVKYIYVKNLEADMICAYLMKKKIVDCIYSTDFDILAFGGKYLMININYKDGYIEYINLNSILKSLKLTHEQFVEMVVVSGCDYSEKRMTLNQAYASIDELKLNNDEKKAKKIFMGK